MRENLQEYTVSALSFALKRTLEDAYGHVRVRGEISGLKRAASGHVYLSLKDADANLDGVMWRGGAAKLAFKPEDGLEVVCTGKITTYPGRSKYQLVIETMEPAGAGALMALLEERRKKLAAEGLFDAARKRPLPYLPEVIGVVTSPTGAVIRDILHRLADRFPRRVLVWPVLVQGERAAEEIAAAIAGFNALPGDGPIPRPDLLIVARGGGSIEDLWAFNEEIVVRAAAASRIPLISAVGHETDTTLIDFASDRRAPTPTAAAEIAVPVRAEILAQVLDKGARLERAQMRRLGEFKTHLQGLGRALPRPHELLALARQRFDNVAERLPQGLRGQLNVVEGRLTAARARLRPAALKLDLDRKTAQLADLDGRRRAAGERRVERARLALEALAKLLHTVSHESVLERGFALVHGADGGLKRRQSEVKPGEALRLTFRDGDVAATAEGGASGAPKRRSKASQGELF